MPRFLLLGSIAVGLSLVACAAEPAADGDPGESSEDALTAKADEHWFYTGALPKLERASVTISLKGNTARVSGLLPEGVAVPDLPHVRAHDEDGRTRLDVVYPIATANVAIGKTNSRPGSYPFYMVKPYRPNGEAVTAAEGVHQVPWGGFPFLAYNRGIALHGPITSEAAASAGDASVWYVRRGAVSGGCNRMLGEHVVELAHVLGVDMRRIYEPNRAYGMHEGSIDVGAKVDVISDYDRYGDKYVDVDYATDTGVTRPGKVYGADQVEMFGSWIATETPDGRDLPPSMKWDSGIAGKPYVFRDHAKGGVVCSLPKALLPSAKALAGSGDLPANLCSNKACYVQALREGGAALARQRCAE